MKRIRNNYNKTKDTDPADHIYFSGLSETSTGATACGPAAAPSLEIKGPSAGFPEREELRVHKEMPYERFLSCGAGSLTNAELLAIILRTGTKEKNATQLSREILGFFESGATERSHGSVSASSAYQGRPDEHPRNRRGQGSQDSLSG